MAPGVGACGAFHDALRQTLKADARRPKHEPRTAKALYAEIRRAGYVGGYTSPIGQENRERDSVDVLGRALDRCHWGHSV